MYIHTCTYIYIHIHIIHLEERETGEGGGCRELVSQRGVDQEGGEGDKDRDGREEETHDTAEKEVVPHLDSGVSTSGSPFMYQHKGSYISISIYRYIYISQLFLKEPILNHDAAKQKVVSHLDR